MNAGQVQTNGDGKRHLRPWTSVRHPARLLTRWFSMLASLNRHVGTRLVPSC